VSALISQLSTQKIAPEDVCSFLHVVKQLQFTLKAASVSMMVLTAPHLHEMQTIVINDPVRLSVCHAAFSRCAEKPERIKVLLKVEPLGDPKHIILDGSPVFLHGFDAAFTKLL